jgi:hypothetical protein
VLAAGFLALFQACLLSEVDQLDEFPDTEVDEGEDADKVVDHMTPSSTSISSLMSRGRPTSSPRSPATQSIILTLGNLVDVHFQETFAGADARLRAHESGETDRELSVRLCQHLARRPRLRRASPQRQLWQK